MWLSVGGRADQIATWLSQECLSFYKQTLEPEINFFLPISTDAPFSAIHQRQLPLLPHRSSWLLGYVLWKLHKSLNECSVFAGSGCPMAPSALALQDSPGLAMLGP